MKTIVLLGLLLWSAATKAWATDVNVTPAAVQSFQQTFFQATNVQWSIVDRFYKADFNIEGEKAYAFFSMDDGTLIASGRHINIMHLPRALQSSLKTHTASFTLTELFEVQSNEGTDYYAAIQKGNETVVLKAAAKKWNVFKKQ